MNGITPGQAPDMSYFDANPRPNNLDKHSDLVRQFIQRQVQQKRRVALVTSGGTTVPLENQTVRFIDNFSAGTRGATSAEYFLENDYAVIFLHRQFSLLPYSRHYSHSTNCFLDFMTYDASGAVVVDDEYQAQMSGVLEKYKRARADDTLLLLPFTTVNEYLWSLREMAMLMQPLGANGVFYLAAAVSDFFVPAERMVEHKIQSSEDFNNSAAAAAATAGSSSEGGGGESAKAPAAHMEGKSLMIDLDPVPKFLKSLVDAWAPKSMIVSFKLETDPSMLATKARYALDKYSHHLVIGNLLATRKYEVLFVSAGEGEQWIRTPEGEENAGGKMMTGEPTVEIESLIVPEVAKMHSRLIEAASQ
ncbi:hypothetical protein MBLNU230_g6733t1 [Neophaeotheca triangularis]